MRALGARLALSVVALATAACSGGGTANSVPARTVPAPTPSATSATASPQSAASVSFSIARPGTAAEAAQRKKRPLYVGATTRSVTITISNTDSTTKTTLTATSSCSTCAFSASATLPVVSSPYTFAFVANGKNGALSSGSTTQTIVTGPNVVDVTLNPIVNSVALAISATPNPNGSAMQVLPVTTKAVDADGNAITGTAAYTIPYQIRLGEVDPLAAFSLVPTSSGSADCQLANSTCALRSNQDSISLDYSPAAGAFATYPAYYPEEAILFEDATNVSSSNSTSVTTPACSPQPLCVYAQPLYPALVAAGGIKQLSTSASILQPIEAISQGSTIYTDSGTITSAGSPPYAFHYNAGPSTQSFAGLTYAPATELAYTVDYSGSTDATGQNQFIDRIAATGASTPLTYPIDPNTTYSSQSQYGDDIILGPDGNLWWIDPLSGDLRYANPSNVSNASVCTLQSGSGANFFLGAYQIVATPPGVMPQRIWFSAFDQVNSNTYVGYVNLSPNSCGSGQTKAHYIEIATDNSGTLSTPNGMAVDGSGNLWYDSSDDTAQDYTSIGEITINGSGALTSVAPKPLPGALGSAQQDWGLTYDASDGNLYFVADGGLIGKFAPASGVSSATAYALPLPLAVLTDVTGNNGNDDGSQCLVASNGSCWPQFSWDAGAGGAHGRLTLVINALQSPSNNNNAIDVVNTVVQVNLDSAAGVTFSAAARSKETATHRSPRRTAKHAKRSTEPALPYPFGTISTRPQFETLSTPRKELALL